MAADATIDLQYSDMNFNNWSVQDGKEQTTLLNVNGTQYTILRWDLGKMEGRKAKGVGLLEISTYDIQRTPDYQKDFGMVRVVEILNGAPEWAEQEITLQKLSQGKNLKEIFNPQMIIDVKIVSATDGRNYITIPEHIIQRMLEGKTRGIVLQPLGAVNATFYARENEDNKRIPLLHFNLEEKE